MASETVRIIDKWLSIPLTLLVLVALALALTSPPAWSQLVPGSMDVHWNEGSSNCARNRNLLFSCISTTPEHSFFERIFAPRSRRLSCTF